MARFTFNVDIAAPRDLVYGLFTDLDRAPEWIEGLARISGRNGSIDQAGTTYVSEFGSWSKSVTTVVAAERPARFVTSFGNWLLRGENEARFEETAGGTRLTQEFRTRGIVPAISGWLFAHGSYRGSFRGELNTFKAMCEREAAKSAEHSERDDQP